METLKREYNELDYVDLLEALKAIAEDRELPEYVDFAVVIVAQRPKEKEPATFSRKAEEPKTFGKQA
jgi:hypothetical protein